MFCPGTKYNTMTADAHKGTLLLPVLLTGLRTVVSGIVETGDMCVIRPGEPEAHRELLNTRVLSPSPQLLSQSTQPHLAMTSSKRGDTAGSVVVNRKLCGAEYMLYSPSITVKSGVALL